MSADQITDQIIKSKYLKWILIGILELIILLGVFNFGMKLGFRKANFSYGWGEHYQENFGGPPRGISDRNPMMENMRDPRNFIDAHGTFGSILKLDGKILVIKGNDNIEKNVLLSEKTTIAGMPRETIKASELKVGDEIMVIGSPNDLGQIEAKFMRVFRIPTK